jgi:hypothetical protein
LAVRQGIEKVFYSKEMITVRFRCGASSDDKSGQNEMGPVSSSAVARPRLPSGLKNERPASGVEAGPSLKLERLQMVEHIVWPPTLDLFFANTGHSYWDHFRLTGEYNVRPTL